MIVDHYSIVSVNEYEQKLIVIIRAPLKRNSTALFVVVTGAAVFLGWAAGLFHLRLIMTYIINMNVSAPRAQTDAEPVFAEPDAPKKKVSSASASLLFFSSRFLSLFFLFSFWFIHFLVLFIL